MTTWRMDVLVYPRPIGPQGGVFLLRRVEVDTDGMGEADDAVGHAETACAIRWPGFKLHRVLCCVATGRGGELRPTIH
jgi:hypothetical protein